MKKNTLVKDEQADTQANEINEYSDLDNIGDIELDDLLENDAGEDEFFETEITDTEPEISKERRKKNSLDVMSKYFDDMSKYPLLTQEEEAQLFRELHGDDPEKAKQARDRLVLSNLRLVASLTRRHTPISLKREDLMQEGITGLMKAIDRYDPEKGFKLSTYATWWIRQAITRAIANKERDIRLPVHLYDKILAVRRAERRATETLGRDPTLEEITIFLLQNEGNDHPTKKEIKERQKDVERCLTYGKSITSIDTKVGEDQENTLADFIADDEDVRKDVENQALASELTEAMLNLTPREEFILRARYGLPNVHGLYDNYEITYPMTLEEVGKVLGVTRERIRQVEDKAMRKLKKPKSSSRLRPFKNSVGR